MDLDVPVTVRLPAGLVERIDKLAETLGVEIGMALNRSQVIRILLEKGIDARNGNGQPRNGTGAAKR